MSSEVGIVWSGFRVAAPGHATRRTPGYSARVGDTGGPIEIEVEFMFGSGQK